MNRKELERMRERESSFDSCVALRFSIKSPIVGATNFMAFTDAVLVRRAFSHIHIVFCLLKSEQLPKQIFGTKPKITKKSIFGLY